MTLPPFKQPGGFEPGIYFNMVDDDYHKDKALSRGGMLKILEIGWLGYWIESPLNPAWKRNKEPTDAMKFGIYSEELLLDEKAFMRKYNCTSAGYNPKKQMINKTVFDKVKESVAEIKAVPGAYEMFTDGYPQVTIIVIDPATGVRLRIRVDYLRVFGGIDYKRCANLQLNPLGWHIIRYGYDLQESLYSYVIMLAKQQLRAGTLKAFGDVDSLWLAKFMTDSRCIFRLFFQRSDRPFIFDIYRFDKMTQDNAAQHVREAIAIYRRSLELYGVARPPAGTSETKEFNFYHLPRRAIDRGDQQFQ